MRKGISLVALVITIVVLIILTATVVMVAGGEEGILGKANKAVNSNNETVAQEKLIMELANMRVYAKEEDKSIYEYLLDETNGAERISKLNNKGIVFEDLGTSEKLKFTVSEYILYTDEDGNLLPGIETKGVILPNVGEEISLDLVAGDGVNEKYIVLEVNGTNVKLAPLDKIDYNFKEKNSYTMSIRNAIISLNEEGRLPDGYIETEYLESTGKQYINSGYTTGAHRFYVDAEYTAKSVGGSYPSYFGSNSGSQEVILCHNLQKETYINGKKVAYIIDLNKRFNYSFETKNGAAYLEVDGKKLFESTGNANGKVIYICASHVAADNNNNADCFQKMKLYSFKVYKDDTLVSDFVPCYSTAQSKYGLYDMVKQCYLGNIGTGDFNGGEYILERSIVLDYTKM